MNNSELVRELAANLYQSMVPQSELSSKSSLSLLASLTLIGFSLASVKPQSVQVLGFTIQADDWWMLAAPLGAVVIYSVVLLILAWMVELRRHRYFVKPLQKKLRRLVYNLLNDNRVSTKKNLTDALDMAKELGREAEQLDSDYETEIDALSQETRKLEAYAKKYEQEMDRCSEIEEKLKWLQKWQETQDSLSAHHNSKSAMRKKNLDQLEEFRRKAGVDEEQILGESRNLESDRKELIMIGRDALHAEKLSRTMIGLGLVVPLLIAALSIGTLIYSVS